MDIERIVLCAVAWRARCDPEAFKRHLSMGLVGERQLLPAQRPMILARSHGLAKASYR
jgi:hypothetical protein